MKVFLSKIIHWILVLGIVINIDGTLVQAELSIQDIINLCNQQSRLHCDWLENYAQLNNVNDVLRQLPEDSKAINVQQNQPPHNHISAREAAYETNDPLPPNFHYRSRINTMLHPNTGKRTFSSWGGKRIIIPDPTSPFTAQGTSSAPAKKKYAFSNWGGKRSHTFFNWGGKRSIPDTEFDDNDNNDNSESNDRLEDDSEHNIMKRDVSTNDDENDTLNRPKRSSDKKLCVTNEINLQELFKEFIEWSRRQPEQKKGVYYANRLISTLRSPENTLNRRAGSFYQWGGKRSLKQN